MWFFCILGVVGMRFDMMTYVSHHQYLCNLSELYLGAQVTYVMLCKTEL